MTTTDPAPTLADLEDRVRNGDTTITANDLTQAREAQNLASLQQEAAQRAQAAADAREHEDAVAQLRADFDAFIGSHRTPARRAYTKAVTAVADLAREVDALNEERSSLVTRASDLGINLPFWDARAVEGNSEEFVAIAVREARGELFGGRNSPHALHTDKQIADHEERQQRIAEAQAAREEAASANTETMVELGYGNYTRRVEV